VEASDQAIRRERPASGFECPRHQRRPARPPLRAVDLTAAAIPVLVAADGREPDHQGSKSSVIHRVCPRLVRGEWSPGRVGSIRPEVQHRIASD